MRDIEVAGTDENGYGHWFRQLFLI